MQALDEKIEAARNELKAVHAETQRSHRQQQDLLLELKRKHFLMERKAKKMDLPLHEYAAAMENIQSPSPPAYVVQKQAIMLRALHRMQSQDLILERAKRQCTQLIRSIRRSIQELEDECTLVESKLLHSIDCLDSELALYRQKKDDVVKKQKEDIRALRQSLGLPAEEEKEEELIKAEIEFNDCLSRSLSKLSASFGIVNFVSARKEVDEPFFHFLGSFSDLKLERTLPEQRSAAPPVA